MYRLRCVPPPIGCGRDISIREQMQWDAKTAREYKISRLCSLCQDKIFKEGEEDK